MRVKAYIKELENLNIRLENNIVNLNNEIKLYLEKIDSLSNSYSSKESEAILSIYSLFVKRVADVSNCYEETNKIIKKAYIFYGEGDEALKKELLKQEQEEKEEYDDIYRY